MKYLNGCRLFTRRGKRATYKVLLPFTFRKIKDRHFKENDNATKEQKDNNIRFMNSLKEANKQLAEDFNKKADNIHSCNDCIFKTNEPWYDPCHSCDLHSNPPSNWMT
mgnify:CR=1 FL=1